MVGLPMFFNFRFKLSKFLKTSELEVFGINILSSEDIMYFQNKVLPLGTCGLGLLRYCNSIPLLW